MWFPPCRFTAMHGPPPELDGVTHRYLDVAGTRLHVAEAGEGPPILLLHGWPQHWWAWRKVIPALAEERRVICPDLRGFGWSDAPPGRYEMQGFATDALALLDELGLDQVELIGHDWGGYAGFLLCLDAPERIDHYLVLGTAHPWFQPPRPSPQMLNRTAYQFLLASPGLGAAVLRHASRLRQARAQARLSPGHALDLRQSSTASRRAFAGAITRSPPPTSIAASSPVSFHA